MSSLLTLSLITLFVITNIDGTVRSIKERILRLFNYATSTVDNLHGLTDYSLEELRSLTESARMSLLAYYKCEELDEALEYKITDPESDFRHNYQLKKAVTKLRENDLIAKPHKYIGALHQKIDTGGDMYIFCTKDRLIISFRGTEFEDADASYNMKYIKDPLNCYCPNLGLSELIHSEFGNTRNSEVEQDLLCASDECLIKRSKASVHRGFQLQYASLRDELCHTVSEYLETINPSEILITGHSLGGSLANLCAIDLTFNKIGGKSRPIRVVTFGTPKVGNWEFRKLMDENVDNLRFVTSADIVPKMPVGPQLLHGYYHCGKGIVLKEDHLGFLEFYNPAAAHAVNRYVNSVRIFKKVIKEVQRENIRKRNANEKLGLLKKFAKYNPFNMPQKN